MNTVRICEITTDRQFGSQIFLKPGTVKYDRVPLVTSLLHVRDVPNATPPQHWRRVHDPRHQAGQQGHGGGRAGDPGQGGDVIH